MAKKKLEGEIKLTRHTTVEKSPSKPLGLMKNKKVFHPRSFRLTQANIQDLKDITTKVNSISNIRLSETKIVQALLHIGTQTKAERILKAIRETI